MRGTLRLIFLGWLALAAFSVQAQPATAEEAFAAGTAAFDEGDHLRALAYFDEARKAGMDGAALHYNIGVAHYRLADYRNAAAAFTLIADRYPEMRGLAQYNLGLVAQRQGDRAAAESYFQQALRNSDDEVIRYLAARQLRADTPPERKEWLTLIDLRFGHDDNVLLLAEDIALPDGQSNESSFTEFWALVSGPIPKERGFRFDGSAFAVRYPDASVFDQTMLRIGGVYEWAWGTWRAELGPHVSYATLDGDTFEKRVGVGARIRREIGRQASFGIRLLHDDISEGASRFAAFKGSRDWLELRVDRRLTYGRFTAAYALEENDREGATVSPRRNKLSLRYQHAFNPRWVGDAQLSFRESRYDELAEPRTEDLTELALALIRTFTNGWQLSGLVSLAANDSAVPTVEYDRNRSSIGVTKQF
jgi:tetratricopeptide (TPR) repeat protein